MTALYLRAYAEPTVEEEGPIRFVASTEGVARDGLVIEAGAWNLDNYRRNPVVLWAHDYMGRNLPIGRADARVDGAELLADVVFDRADPFAAQIERKYRAGFLNAVSVGWETQQVRPGRAGEPARITRADLLDISAVPVPSDPSALMERNGPAVRSILEWIEEIAPLEAETRHEHRGAIPPHSTAKADEGASWDGPGQVAKAEGAAQLRMMHAWVDDDADPETKQAYKLPHHTAEGEVVWRGVAAAMARLLQAGTQIPDADRQGVYRHLERHYRQFDKTAPEFRTLDELTPLGDAELRGLFLEGEEEHLDPAPDVRVGAVLNARNRERLAEAVRLIGEVIASAEKAAEEEAPSRAHYEPGTGNEDYDNLYASFLKGLAGRIK